MKTISSRFLKGAVAVLLAVLMVFGSTLTGFAAVVENADTKANVDIATTSHDFSGFSVIFDNTNTKWSDVYLFVGHGSWSSPNKLTQIGNTNLYALTDFSWGGATEFCFATGLSGWEANGESVSHRTGYCTNSKIITMSGSYSGFFYAKAASGNDGAATTCTNSQSGYNYYNHTQTAKIYSTTGSTYTEDTAAGSVAYSTFKLDSNNSSTATTGTNSVTAAKTAEVTMTATANNGYVFKGWTTTQGGAPTSTSNPLTYTCSGTTTYYACFEKNISYSVTFNKNCTDTVNNMPNGTTVTTSGTNNYTLPTNEPEREGYTFNGWYKDNTSSGTVYSAGVSTTISSNTTFYAKWTKKTYTVSYNVNGGSGNIGTQTKTHGENLTLTTVKPTPPAGKKFSSWNTKQDGTGTMYESGGTYAVNAAVTLYAQYVDDNVTYTFYDYGRTRVLASGTVTSGTDVSEFAPDPIERKGYTHSGWTPTLGEITVNTEFEPNYELNEYTITLEANGGSVTPSEYTYYVTSDPITLPTPTRDHYDFLGWKDEQNIVSTEVTIPTDSIGNRTYTAQWEAKTYTVSAVASPTAGGTVTVDKTSVTYGETINLTATANTGYRFNCWLRNGTAIAYTAQYSETPEGDATYTAQFVKQYTATIVIPEGVEHIALNGDVIKENNYKYTKDENTTRVVSASAKSGYRVTDILIDGQSVGSRTYELVFTKDVYVSAKVEKTYTVTVDGSPISNTYIAGETVNYTIPAVTGEYITNVQITSNGENVDAEVNKLTGEISFNMPAGDVNVVVTREDMYTVTFDDPDVISAPDLLNYYIPGETVSFKASPAGGETLEKITYGDNEWTADDNGDISVSFVMPNENVTLSVTYTASHKITLYPYKRDVYTKAYSYSGSSVGNVKFESGFESSFSGHSSPIQTNTTAKDVVISANPQSGYTFAGWYTDSSFSTLVSRDKEYEFRPTADTSLYALFVEDFYIIGLVEWDNWYELSYDPATNKYFYISEDKRSSEFKFSDNKGWNDNLWNYIYAHDEDANNGIEVTKGNNGNYNITDSNKYPPVTIYFWPNGSSTNNNGVVYNHFYYDATASDEEDTSLKVYLSSGIPQVVGADKSFMDFSPVTTITTTEGIKNVSNLLNTGTNAACEKYYEVKLEDTLTIDFKTTISGDDKENVEIYQYVYYAIESGKTGTIQPEYQGDGVYTGSFTVTEPCYIVPVYFASDTYISNNEGMDSIEVVFDGASIDGQKWGPFVSCYPYGDATTTKYFGVWPGQLMVPDGTGSFYTKVAIPSGSNPQGFVFNNAMSAGDGISKLPYVMRDIWDLSQKEMVQTYDYREGVTLHEMKHELIVFSVREGDEYHGDSYESNGSAGYSDGAKPVTSGSIDISDFTFKPLLSRNKNFMDMNGNEIVNEDGSFVTDGTPSFYIVSKGDVEYTAKEYSYDEGYSGQWSVEWYVYDSTGNYLTHGLSDTFYHPATEGANQPSVMVSNMISKITGATDMSYFDNKIVHISYEAPNKGHSSHYKAVDGQWYGDAADAPVPAEVYVATVDNDGNYTYPDPKTNEADFGQGYIVLENGDLVQNTEISFEIGEINLSARSSSGYKFVGWYRYNEDLDKMVLIPNGTSANVNGAQHNTKSTYYAVFKELEQSEVAISHTPYLNLNDPSIPSHGGVGELSIKLYDTDGTTLLDEVKPNINGDTLTFNAVDEKTYWIEIITTPRQEGAFYAWYTDAKTDSGKDTYEEILTDENCVGSTETVSARFMYITGKSPQSINIYSDISKPSAYATIQYLYESREGKMISITKNNILLTPEEISGKNTDGSEYAGNEGKRNCPQYIDSYVLKKDDEVVHAFTDAEKKEYENNGYVAQEGTYNKVQAYAPYDDTTEVFNTVIEWTIDEEHTNYELSYVTVRATQYAAPYKLTYIIDGTIEYENGYYNDSVQLDAPAKLGDQVFLYWRENLANGEYKRVCYTTFYNYRIEGDKTIEAVYGTQAEKDALRLWDPIIDRVVYTREVSDTTDYVYTDFLISYTSKKSEVLDEIKGTGIKYGLIMVRDAGYVYDGNGDKEYPDHNAIIDGVKTTAAGGKHAVINGTDGATYNGYCYDLTAKDTTNFNRINYYIRFNTNNAKQKGYTFTCYAYMQLADGSVVISEEPVYTSIWDAANKPVN